jgi:hypothetical protein
VAKRFPLPGQQCRQPALGDIGDVGEHVREPGERIDVVELGRLYRPPNYAEEGEQAVVGAEAGSLAPSIRLELCQGHFLELQ